MDDIEMELDLGEGLGPAEDEINFDAPQIPTESSDAPPVAMEADPVPTKVHLRGVDEMTTKDIKAFVREHFTEEAPAVEWIDDTSANLAFSSAELASRALEVLAQPAATAIATGEISNDGVNPLQLRNAKTYSEKPGTELAVRLAVSTDRKKPRAADESRFYLMHPEHDPRERRRQRAGRSGSRDGGMRRRRYGNDEQARRRRDDERQGFAASMYDDDEEMSGAGATSDEERRRGGRRERDTYRPGGRSRDRSRSPTSRREDNKGKELFSSGSRSAQNQVANAGKELFSERKAAGGSALAGDDSVPAENAHERNEEGGSAARELFPSSSNNKGSLFSRVSGPAINQRVDGAGGEGVSIRGAAGFSIKGASSSAASTEATENKLRELFPDRNSNANANANANRNRGKELMDRVTPATAAMESAGGRRERRGAGRNKADTFY